jgi:transposase
MKKTRNRREAALKVKVALEAIKEARTIAEIASEFKIHPTQVSEWKRQLLDGAAGVFDKKGQRETAEDFARERERLHAKIGELTVDVDFLTKKSKQLGL